MALVTTKYGTKIDPNLKVRLSKEIMNSVEESPDLIKEINKIYKQANTRINRLKDSGLDKVSPAYQALGSMTNGAHEKWASRTYFSQKTYFDAGGTARKSWEDIKQEYARAVAFLNQESSQISGAKAVERTLRENTEKYLGRNLPDDVWESVKNGYVDSIGYVDDRLMKAEYSYFLERFGEYVEQMESQMARDANEAVRVLEEAIQEQTEELAGLIIDDVLDDIDF